MDNVAPRRDVFDAPQVVHSSYPEYVEPKHESVHNTVSEANEPAIVNPSLLHRRLGDMNAFTFWLLIFVVAIIIIAASVGGAVGGTASASKNRTTQTVTLSPTAQSTTLPTSSASQPSSSSSTTLQSSAAATPSYIIDCPASNASTYTPQFAPNQSYVTFTKYCSSNLLGNDTEEVFVESFDDCIEACAGLNHFNKNITCASVTWCTNSERPADCWAHNSYIFSPDDLTTSQTCDTALLQL